MLMSSSDQLAGDEICWLLLRSLIGVVVVVAPSCTVIASYHAAGSAAPSTEVQLSCTHTLAVVFLRQISCILLQYCKSLLCILLASTS
jgi:hypothetical protein